MRREFARGLVSIGVVIWGLAACAGPGLEPPADDFASNSPAERPATPAGQPMRATDAGMAGQPAPGVVPKPDDKDCSPGCAARSCGDDGCGGSCGACGSGLACNQDGECVCDSEADSGDCADAGCGEDCDPTR